MHIVKIRFRFKLLGLCFLNVSKNISTGSKQEIWQCVIFVQFFQCQTACAAFLQILKQSIFLWPGRCTRFKIYGLGRWGRVLFRYYMGGPLDLYLGPPGSR